MKLMNVNELMTKYKVGSEEWSWEEEFSSIAEVHAQEMLNLMMDIKKNGFQVPVLLGDDGRIWDGHHRIFAAYLMGLDIPVTKDMEEAGFE